MSGITSPTNPCLTTIIPDTLERINHLSVGIMGTGDRQLRALTALPHVQVQFLAPTSEGSQQLVTQALGNPMSSSGLHGHHIHVHIPTFTPRTYMSIYV